MAVRHVPLVAVLTLFVTPFAGCIERPPYVDATEVFVLDYQIVDLSPGQGPRSASPGEHCAEVGRQDDTLTLGLWPDEEAGPIWLVVFPSLPERWRASYDGEPFKARLPTTVDPRVQDDDTTIGRLGWEPSSGGERGVLRLDDRPISLPHRWTVTATDGSWRADATLAAWQGEVRTERYGAFCD